MSQYKFPLTARALVRLTIDPPLERVEGFGKDGRPRIQQLHRWVWPQQFFYIRDQEMLDALMPPSRPGVPDEVFAEIVESVPIGADWYDGTPGTRRGPTQRRLVMGAPAARSPRVAPLKSGDDE